MTSTAMFDPGLQPERTSLAWRRTALSVAVGSIVSLRVLPVTLEHGLWHAPGVVGVAFAAWMWWVAHRRHTVFSEQIGSDSEPRQAGASALFALVLFTISVGIVGLVAVMARGA